MLGRVSESNGVLRRLFVVGGSFINFFLSISLFISKLKNKSKWVDEHQRKIEALSVYQVSSKNSENLLFNFIIIDWAQLSTRLRIFYVSFYLIAYLFHSSAVVFSSCIRARCSNPFVCFGKTNFSITHFLPKCFPLLNFCLSYPC